MTRSEHGLAADPVATEQSQVLGALLAGCAEGDETALARFYVLTSPWLFALVRRRTASIALAEDRLVSVYVKIWRNAGSWNHGSALAWATAVACEVPEP